MNDKISKSDAINSVYALIHNLSVIFLSFLLPCIFCNDYINGSVLIIFIILLLHKSKRFAAYRVRVVMRTYESINK